MNLPEVWPLTKGPCKPSRQVERRWDGCTPAALLCCLGQWPRRRKVPLPCGSYQAPFRGRASRGMGTKRGGYV